MSNASDDGTTPNEGNSNDARSTGRVKWFNNRAGFGFVTVLDGDKKGEDVFVHHSGIVVESEQYKYLVQGEYVNFSFRESDNTEHPYQAGEVRGVLEGWLMCETRNANRSNRDNEEGSAEGDEGNQSRRPRPRRNNNSGGGGGGRDNRRPRRNMGRDNEGGQTDEWVLTRRRPGNNRRGQGSSD